MKQRGIALGLVHNGRPLRGGRGLKLLLHQGRCDDQRSPPTRGARIETLSSWPVNPSRLSRPLRGGRGLKRPRADIRRILAASPPTRGARIETPWMVSCSLVAASPPTRGARIETVGLDGWSICRMVAPYAGGAD